MFWMTGEKAGDDKIICVPADDPRQDHLCELEDVPEFSPPRDPSFLHRLQGDGTG
jgi:inorganic pyrophosphatase